MSTCPEWCVQDHQCQGDHMPVIGGVDWPTIQATAWALDGEPEVTVYPTWGEVDGCSPAVALHIESCDGHRDTDDTFDLTPVEARALAAQLLRAADAL